MRAISADLRERVLKAIQEGETTSEISERFEVSPAWVRRFHQRFKATGETTPRKRTLKRVPKLKPFHDKIHEVLKATPDTTLQELRKELGVQVALSTLWYAVYALGLTFKKK
jgi:transposase